MALGRGSSTVCETPEKPLAITHPSELMILLEDHSDRRIVIAIIPSGAAIGKQQGEIAMIKLITLHFVAIALGSGATLAVAYTWCM